MLRLLIVLPLFAGTLGELCSYCCAKNVLHPCLNYKEIHLIICHDIETMSHCSVVSVLTHCLQNIVLK